MKQLRVLLLPPGWDASPQTWCGVAQELRRPTWPELIPVQHEATESIVTPPPGWDASPQTWCGVAQELRRPTWPELIPVQHEATESIVTPPWMGC